MKVTKDMLARWFGYNGPIKLATTAQRRQQEQSIREILRGNVTWGTPIVRGA
jgi:hypothetical protein